MLQKLSTILFLQYLISISAYTLSLNRESIDHQVFSPYCEALCQDLGGNSQLIDTFKCDCLGEFTNSKINIYTYVN